MTEIPDLPSVLERLLEGGEHDAVGAYALDALPPDERATFEAHLADCDQCMAELLVLRHSAEVLRQAIQPAAKPSTPARPPEPAVPAPPAENIEKAGDADIPQSGPEPEAALPVETPSEIETPATYTLDQFELALPETPAVIEAPAPAPRPATSEKRPARPRGRVAPGVHTAAPFTATAPPKLPWITATVGVLIGVVALLAALALAEMKGNLEEEIDVQNEQIAQLNAERETYLEQTTAVTWTLEPTTLGAPNSTAIVFADPSATSAILAVTGMNPLNSDQAYQVWYLRANGEAVAGPVFTVDNTGGALVQVEPNISQYLALAITTEPAGGSIGPSTDPVVQGFVSQQ